MFLRTHRESALAEARRATHCARTASCPRRSPASRYRSRICSTLPAISRAPGRKRSPMPPRPQPMPAWCGVLRQAGAIIVGRTNMVEFAFSGLGLNPHYGTPRNPWDRATGRIPGGSSSGAAVSVSDGMAAMGLGTDTGGSVRIPAALCGLTGFKPTARRISTDGTLPLSTTLDSIGPIARSVACCALVDSILAGEAPQVPPALPLKGLRLGVVQDYVAGRTWTAPWRRLSAAALTRLSQAGALRERGALRSPATAAADQPEGRPGGSRGLRGTPRTARAAPGRVRPARGIAHPARRRHQRGRLYRRVDAARRHDRRQRARRGALRCAADADRDHGCARHRAAGGGRSTLWQDQSRHAAQLQRGEFSRRLRPVHSLPPAGRGSGGADGRGAKRRGPAPARSGAGAGSRRCAREVRAQGSTQRRRARGRAERAAIDRRAARRASSRAAATYADAAVLAREVEARMLERLQYIKLAPQRILDAGCGEGHGAGRLAEVYPDAQVLGLDFAYPMLQAARGQGAWLRRVLGAQARRLSVRRFCRRAAGCGERGSRLVQSGPALRRRSAAGAEGTAAGAEGRGAADVQLLRARIP